MWTHSVDAEIPFAEASVVDCNTPPVPKLVNVVAVAPETVNPVKLGEPLDARFCDAVRERTPEAKDAEIPLADANVVVCNTPAEL